MCYGHMLTGVCAVDARAGGSVCCGRVCWRVCVLVGVCAVDACADGCVCWQMCVLAGACADGCLC